MKRYEINAQDSEKLRGLAQLDEKQFAEMLSSVASGLGMNDRQKASLVSNSEAVRKMLAGASDYELKRLSSRLGKERTGAILDAVEKKTDSEET